MKYKVNLKKTEEERGHDLNYLSGIQDRVPGSRIWVPGLPGCWSQGSTEAEAMENIKDATEGYLEAVEELTKGNESRYVEVAHA